MQKPSLSVWSVQWIIFMLWRFPEFWVWLPVLDILSKDDLNYMDLFHAIKECEYILLLEINWSHPLISVLTSTSEKIVLTAETSEQSSHQASILASFGGLPHHECCKSHYTPFTFFRKVRKKFSVKLPPLEMIFAKCKAVGDKQQPTKSPKGDLKVILWLYSFVLLTLILISFLKVIIFPFELILKWHIINRNSRHHVA